MIRYIIYHSIILTIIYAYKNFYKLRIKPSNLNEIRILRKEKAERYRTCKDLIHLITWLAIWVLAFDIVGGTFNILTGHSFYRVFIYVDEDDGEKYSTLWMFRLSFWALVLNFLSYRILLKRSPKKLLIIIVRPFIWVIETIVK